MGIRVLGCSGAIASGCKTTAFLVDQHLLIDAGTGVGDLTLDEMTLVDHVLLSHSHLDHILGIPLMADATLRRRMATGRGPITLHALPETLQALQAHVLNNVIWPDFTRVPRPDAPALRLAPLAIGQCFELAGRQIEVLPAVHTVPAVGYAVQGKGHGRWWAFSGDTGPNPALFERLNQLDLAHLVIEAAFSDDEAALAAIALHHCPQSLAADLMRLRRPVDPATAPEVWLTHIKPGELQAILAGIQARHVAQRLRPLVDGQVFVGA